MQFIINISYLFVQRDEKNKFYRSDGGCYKIIEQPNLSNVSEATDDDDLINTYSLDGVAVW